MLSLIGSIIGLITVLAEKLIPAKMPIKRSGKIRSKNDLMIGLRGLRRKFSGKTIEEIAAMGRRKDDE